MLAFIVNCKCYSKFTFPIGKQAAVDGEFKSLRPDRVRNFRLEVAKPVVYVPKMQSPQFSFRSCLATAGATVARQLSQYIVSSARAIV